MTDERKLSWEYVAGFLDGEGSITLSSQSRAKGYPYYEPLMRISNTSFYVLSLIRDFIGGGKICITKKLGYQNKNHRQVWVYQLTGRRNLFPVLMALRPYLVLKLAQADEVIAFMGKMRPKNNKGVSGLRLSEREVQERQGHVDRIRKLNRRGVWPTEVRN